MRSTPRKAALAAAVLVVVFTRCWDRREIETLGFVVAVGIDGAEYGSVKLTAQVANSAAMSPGDSGTSGSARGKQFWLASGTGRTSLEAVRNLLSRSLRRLFFPHNRWIIFGEETGEGAYRPTSISSSGMWRRGCRSASWSQGKWRRRISWRRNSRRILSRLKASGS